MYIGLPLWFKDYHNSFVILNCVSHLDDSIIYNTNVEYLAQNLSASHKN